MDVISQAHFRDGKNVPVLHSLFRSSPAAFLLLTPRTIKRRALGLDDSEDRCVPAGVAGFVLFGVDGVVVLVAAGLVEGVAVGSVAERRAFVADRRFEDFRRRAGDPFVVGGREIAAAGLRMDFRTMQNFRRVEVADPRDPFLVEQCDFDLGRGRSKSRDPIGGRHREGVRSEAVFAEPLFPLRRVVERAGSETATVPEPDFSGRSSASERPFETEVLDIGRIVDQEEAGHPRFDHQPVSRVVQKHDPLADATEFQNLRSLQPLRDS